MGFLPAFSQSGFVYYTIIDKYIPFVALHLKQKRAMLALLPQVAESIVGCKLRGVGSVIVKN